MKLQRISVELQDWGDHEGQYTGSCRFVDDNTKVEIRITPDCANRILLLCAEGVAEAAKQTAAMTKDVIEKSVLMLENKVEAEAEASDD